MRSDNQTRRLQVCSFAVFLLPFSSICFWSMKQPSCYILGCLLFLAMPIISLYLSACLRNCQTTVTKRYWVLYVFCAGTTCVLLYGTFFAMFGEYVLHWKEGVYYACAYCGACLLAALLIWKHLQAFRNIPRVHTATAEAPNLTAMKKEKESIVQNPVTLMTPSKKEQVCFPLMPAWFMDYGTYCHTKPRTKYLVQTGALYDEIGHFNNICPQVLIYILHTVSALKEEHVPNAAILSKKVQNILLQIKRVDFSPLKQGLESFPEDATQNQIQTAWAAIDAELERCLRAHEAKLGQIEALCNCCSEFHE